jgi:hypothetical protein
VAHLAFCILLVAAECSPSGSRHRLPAAKVPCRTDTGPAVILREVRTEKAAVPGAPSDVVTTRDGAWSFVSLGPSIGVFSHESFAPRLVRQIPVPGRALGEVLSGDGRFLVVADEDGVDVIDAAAATRGDPAPVTAVLRTPSAGTGGGAIKVALSRDDRYAFVTRENDNDLAVFDLARAGLDGRHGSAFVGSVPLGSSPVGIALSGDGHWLYATSQAGAPPGRVPAGGPLAPNEGTLSVIDVSRTATDPGKAVVSTVAAGCNPVRVIISADGGTLWVSARASNEVLGFSSARARADPRHALVARVHVGQAPTGLALVREGTRLVVANSDRFSAPGSAAGLSVIDTAAALGAGPAVLGVIPSGRFPRDFALSPDGSVLLVTNYASAELQAVDVRTVP